MHSFALVANMDKQWSWNKVYELRKILKDKKTRIVKGKDGKLKGGVDFVDGSDLYNKYSKELADLEAKMARAKESRNGHNKKQLVVKAVVCSDQMPIMNKVPLPATTVVKQEALLLVPPAVKQEKEEISTAADDWRDAPDAQLANLSIAADVVFKRLRKMHPIQSADVKNAPPKNESNIGQTSLSQHGKRRHWQKDSLHVELPERKKPDSGKSRVTKPPDDWNDPEAKPRWLDKKTRMSRTEYLSYSTVITKECRDMFDYRVFLPHQAPKCGMSTTFGDLCDFLCEPLKQAHNVREKRRLRDLLSEPDKRAYDVREKRRGLVGSAELPIGLKIQLWAAKKEQEALLKEMDITLLSMQNCAAMNTIYDLLSTAWKRRLEKKAKRRSIILRTHWRRSKKTGEVRVPL